MKKQDTIAAVVINVPKPSSAFSSIGKVKIHNEEMPMVAFNNLDAAIKAKFFKLEKGQSIMIEGRLDPYAKMGKRVIANDVHDAESYEPAKELTVEEALMVPDPNLEPLEERTLPERKYAFKDPRNNQIVEFWSDGLYAWKQGHKDKKAKLTYEFLEKYNSYCKAENHLKPDWYSVEQAKRMIQVQEENPSIKSLLEEYATY